MVGNINEDEITNRSTTTTTSAAKLNIPFWYETQLLDITRRIEFTERMALTEESHQEIDEEESEAVAALSRLRPGIGSKVMAEYEGGGDVTTTKEAGNKR